MRSIYNQRENDLKFEPMCMEGPPQKRMKVRSLSPFLILIFLILLSLPPPASEYTSNLGAWFYYGLRNDEWATDVISTTDGGFALLGYTSLVGEGKIDGIIMKFNEYGELQWNITIGGEGDDYVTSIIQTKDEGFIITGLSDPFINFDYGPDLFPNDNATAWIIRLHKNGFKFWSKIYSEILWIDKIVKINDEGFTFMGLKDNKSLFIRSIDREGAVLWGETYIFTQLGLEDCRGLKPSSFIYTDDDYYLLGISTLWNELYLLKFDRWGELVWNKKYNSSKWGEAMYGVDNIVEITDGYVIMGRHHRHCGEGCHPEHNVPFVMKIDQGGHPLWNTSYESFLIYYWSRNYNALADRLIGGRLSSTCAQDKGYLLGKENWIFKINQEGVKEWNQTINGKIFSLCQLKDDSTILVGSKTTTTVDHDSTSDIWIAKTNKLGIVQWEKVFSIQQAIREDPLLVEVKTSSNNTQSQEIPFFELFHGLIFIGLSVYTQKGKIKKKRL